MARLFLLVTSVLAPTAAFVLPQPVGVPAKAAEWSETALASSMRRERIGVRAPPSEQYGPRSRPANEGSMSRNRRWDNRQDWWESGSTRPLDWQDDRNYDRRQTRNYDRRGGGGSMYDSGNSVVEGGSRRTYSSGFPYYSNQHEWHVDMDTDGRPLDAEVEVWDGPNNAVQKVRTRSMDGGRSRFSGIFNGGESMSIRNTGPLEFPAYASARIAPRAARLQDFPRNSPPVTIQGEKALKTWTFGPEVEEVLVELESQGMPVDAKVEIWQGPSQVEQVAEIYSQDGYHRPYATVIDTRGYNYGGTTTIAVRNMGPMTFPLTARLEPSRRNW